MFERARCRVNHANSGEKEPEIHTESRLIFKKATHLRGLQVPLGKPHEDFARLELNRPGREAGPAFNQCSGWGFFGGAEGAALFPAPSQHPACGSGDTGCHQRCPETALPDLSPEGALPPSCTNAVLSQEPPLALACASSSLVASRSLPRCWLQAVKLFWATATQLLTLCRGERNQCMSEHSMLREETGGSWQ